MNARLSYAVLSSTYRHLWYLTPQLVTLALTDTGLEDSSREEMARALHTQERGKVEMVEEYRSRVKDTTKARLMLC